jgi:predicted transcriptional regulator
MAKEKPVKLTRLELEIMGAVWTLGSASVREIQEQLPEPKRPAYTTVQTIIYRLEEKGAVRRVKKIGNAHIFEAIVTRKAAHGRLIDELLHVFGGSPRSLMAQLVETGQLTLHDIRDLENTLATLTSKRSATSRAGSSEKKFARGQAQTDKHQGKRLNRPVNRGGGSTK